MTSLTLTLPWPSADLSPNARIHRMEHYRAKKAAKNAAWGFTTALLKPIGITRGSWTGPIAVHTVFHPPAGYRYDEDGLVSRMKAPWDGIALALGVDDHTFRHTHERAEPFPPLGKVLVTLTPAAVDIPLLGRIS